MLRNHQYHGYESLRGQNCLKKNDDQSKPTRENDPRNRNSSFAEPRERGGISQFFRGPSPRLHRVGVVPAPIHDGAAQTAQNPHRTGNPVLHESDRARRALSAPQSHHSQGLKVGKFVFERPVARENRRFWFGGENILRW